VHGKGSLLNKMPGDRWQKFANLRAYFGFMFGHPGKKLMFMGGEFAQEREWTHDHSLDWHLLGDGMHQGVQHLVRDLNHAYRSMPALYEVDFDGAGFEWIDHHDAANSVISFLRYGNGGRTMALIVCNFTPAVQRDYRIGVPRSGEYVERVNTDSMHYGGSNVGTPFGRTRTQDVPWHGRAQSLQLTLPPLGTLIFEWIAG
jgi:1,4-alpha-glucan branching enzyme